MKSSDVNNASSGDGIEYPKFESVNPSEKTDKYVGAIRACRVLAFENKGTDQYPLEEKYRGLFQRVALLELTDGKSINAYWKLVLTRTATSAEDKSITPSLRARQFNQACLEASVEDWEEDLPGRTISIECFGKLKGSQGMDVRFKIGEPGSGDSLISAVAPIYEAQLKALNPDVDFDELAAKRAEKEDQTSAPASDKPQDEELPF